MAWGPAGEEEDLFGTAVQLAARICAHTEPGEILAPIVVRELAAGKGFLFADWGDVALRGFEEAVRLYEVRWREGQRFPPSGETFLLLKLAVTPCCGSNSAFPRQWTHGLKRVLEESLASSMRTRAPYSILALT